MGSIVAMQSFMVRIVKDVTQFIRLVLLNFLRAGLARRGGEHNERRVLVMKRS